jgi:hypothetical protein
MVKKSIAAVLLVVVVAWAEMAIAPMLAMHVLHVHPAREMAANMASHHDVMPAGHPCCPKISKTENAAPLELTASALPCQDQHRCCLLQGPQNLPVPVNDGQKISQEIALAETVELNPVLAQSHISFTTTVAPGPPPGLFGMVLRV